MAKHVFVNDFCYMWISFYGDIHVWPIDITQKMEENWF